LAQEPSTRRTIVTAANRFWVNLRLTALGEVSAPDLGKAAAFYETLGFVGGFKRWLEDHAVASSLSSFRRPSSIQGRAEL